MAHYQATTSIFILIVSLFLACQVQAKALGFRDPNTNHFYTLTLVNSTRVTPESPAGSLIKVTRVKLNEFRQHVGQEEFIQTLKFSPTLVDFDLQCSHNHCYMVAIVNRTKRNIELYAWQRTQFDLLTTRDSFARPHAVQLFDINSGFYIVIAQDQYHLSSKAAEADDGPKFMGCVVLKFAKNREHDVKYHQFIKLSFNPHHVKYFKSTNTNNLTDLATNSAPSQNHHLVFSANSNWGDESDEDVRQLIWSPLNDYFWPYRVPRGTKVVESKPGHEVLKFPEPQLTETVNSSNPWRQQDLVSQTEICFYQLQKLLSDRDLESRRMIDSSKSIWRAPNQSKPYAQHPAASLTNISAQVVVHGNVLVRGSIIDNPQVSLIANNQRAMPNGFDFRSFVSSHSPTEVENNIKQAMFKLDHIREKVSRAITANMVGGDGTFYHQVRFLGGIYADEVVIRGVANSDVRLNGIPFRQLENELVSLIGAQNIAGRIVFAGKVVADRLEIHGLINDHYYLKDAIDIMSDRMQIIETSSLDHVVQAPGSAAIDFRSIGAPEVILAHNATLNSIRLGDFITRDNRTQVVIGRKTFGRLSMSKLSLAHQSVLLNGVNISRVAQNAIRLQPNPRGAPYQTMTTNRRASFLKTIRVNRLSVNSLVNQHINMTSLIHDSIKTNTYEVQQIFGQKNFTNGLKIDRLNTDGSLNGIKVDKIFNLNSLPPIGDQQRLANISGYHSAHGVPITGEFQFQAPVRVFGRVDANLVNGIDLTRRAVRRLPHDAILSNGEKPKLAPQLVRGHKTFFRPLRIVNDIRMIDPQRVMLITNNTQVPQPLINSIDLGVVNSGLKRLKDHPPPIIVETLNIEGNLDVVFQTDGNGVPRTTFGNYTTCPLDLIRSRAMLAGAEDQVIQMPIRIKSLRANTILVDPNAFNGYNFPADFVLRTAASPNGEHKVEPVYGVKNIERLVLSPSFANRRNPDHIVRLANQNRAGVVLERGVSINQVPWSELQTFLAHERNLNSTGEKVFKTINVYGNLRVKRINDHYWPDDILLRSVSSNVGHTLTPSQHKRIYTHLIFTNTSNLLVENQLVLRGPIQLNGLMNGINLTEFSGQSATYGDKDLFSNGRPIRNKIFLGGLTVRGEIRSQGLIDGVSFDDMKRRVVTIAPTPKDSIVITSPKMFMSDVVFEAPTKMIYLHDMPMDSYLSRIRFEPDGTTLKVYNKKTITGALRINRNLYVRGLINGIDFGELKARAISLAPTDQELAFNKTLIVEGDVFMDNLWIDEHNGTIDGVKLKNLLPIGPLSGNEFVLSDPRVSHQPTPYGRVTEVHGSLMDCQVKCEVQPIHLQHQPAQRRLKSSARSFEQPSLSATPIVIPAQPVMIAYNSTPPMYRFGNYSVTRTTPPYSMASVYQPPFRLPAPTSAPRHMPILPPASYEQRMQQLAHITPVSIRYEQRHAPTRSLVLPKRFSKVAEQLESLRRQIITINLVRLHPVSDLVVGFIDAPSNDVLGYSAQKDDHSHFHYKITHPGSYIELDQIDFKVTNQMHHISIGVMPNNKNENMTIASYWLGGVPLNKHGEGVLPVENPNSAMFVDLPDINTLFLLISQDQTIGSAMCPSTEMIHSFDRYVETSQNYHTMSQLENGIHVYIFQAFKPNSTSYRTAYFDLYQTINLDGIDSFVKFKFRGSSYVLAISRALERIYLLMLRGYTGFQVVSWFDAPTVESVRVMYTANKEPVLDISLTSGMHRIMESVVI